MRAHESAELMASGGHPHYNRARRGRAHLVGGVEAGLDQVVEQLDELERHAVVADVHGPLVARVLLQVVRDELLELIELAPVDRELGDQARGELA